MSKKHNLKPTNTKPVATPAEPKPPLRVLTPFERDIAANPRPIVTPLVIEGATPIAGVPVKPKVTPQVPAMPGMTPLGVKPEAKPAAAVKPEAKPAAAKPVKAPKQREIFKILLTDVRDLFDAFAEELGLNAAEIAQLRESESGLDRKCFERLVIAVNAAADAAAASGEAIAIG